MKFGVADEPISETNGRKPFPLALPSTTIQPSQPGTIPDRMRSGNCLNLPDGTDELEVHLPRRRSIIGVPTSLTFAVTGRRERQLQPASHCWRSVHCPTFVRIPQPKGTNSVQLPRPLAPEISGFSWFELVAVSSCSRLKILVWEDGQRKVWISYNSQQYLQERHGSPPELLANIAVVETLVAKAAA
jgi:hypothetical protein